MKKRLFCLILASALLLSSCQKQSEKKKDDPSQKSVSEKVADTVDKIISTDPEPLRTVEYSVLYLDRNTGLSSYDTASLEQSEPLSPAFLLDKVIKLSALPVSVLSVSSEENRVAVDFDPNFFLSEQNTEKNEASILYSVSQSLLRNLDDADEVYFSLDGEDFITDYHAIDSDIPFLPEMLDEPLPEVSEISFTVSYYDVYTDQTEESEQLYRYIGEPNYLCCLKRISRLFEIQLGINSVTVKNNAVTVDFADGKAPVYGTGSYEESRILDCISDVLLQILPEVNEVYITKDGGDYDSGHIKTEKNTPYATRKQARIG